MTVYEKITSEKEASLGKTMTVKEATDILWLMLYLEMQKKIGRK